MARGCGADVARPGCEQGGASAYGGTVVLRVPGVALVALIACRAVLTD